MEPRPPEDLAGKMDTDPAEIARRKIIISGKTRDVISYMVGDNEIFDRIIEENQQKARADGLEEIPANMTTLHDLTLEQQREIGGFVLSAVGLEDFSPTDADNVILEIISQAEQPEVEPVPEPRPSSTPMPEPFTPPIPTGPVVTFSAPEFAPEGPSTPPEPESAPVAEALPDDNDKAKRLTLERLRETIRVARERLVEIDRELAEIPEEAKVAQEIIVSETSFAPEKASELSEDIRNLIDDILTGLKRSLKSFEGQENTDMIEFNKAQIKLLKSDPIKYFTKERDRAKEMLSFCLSHDEYTETEKQKYAIMWNKEIEKFQRVIDALEASLKK